MITGLLGLLSSPLVSRLDVRPSGPHAFATGHERLALVNETMKGARSEAATRPKGSSRRPMSSTDLVREYVSKGASSRLALPQAVLQQEVIQQSGIAHDSAFHVDTASIEKLVSTIDRVYFGNELVAAFGDHGYRLIFKSMVHQSGLAAESEVDIGRHELTLWFNSVLFDSMDPTSHTFSAMGIEGLGVTQALFHVVAHELVHLIVVVLFDKGMVHAGLFMEIAHNMFSHTAFTHALTPRAQQNHEYNLEWDRAQLAQLK